MAIQIKIAEQPYSKLLHYRGTFTRIHENKEDSREFEIVYEINHEDLRKRINFYARGHKFMQSEKEDILKQFNLQVNNDLVSSNTGESNINEG